MSVAVLTEVYTEARRLAIAGSVVAGGDFRLKKLVPPLQKAGEKAPIFGRVAEAVNKVVDSSEKTSAEAMLELCSLLTSILYTQGETGLAGEIQPIESVQLGTGQSQISARALKPLLEALTSTGPGRLEQIRECHERGLFRDLRLVKPAVGAIDDPYPEIGEFVATSILPMYGKAILPDIRSKFDIKGKAGHLRRLALLHKLDPEGTRETVKQALDDGSKEMKVVAIECLGDSPEDLGFLLEQSKARAKDVRQAAAKALHKMDAPEAVAAVRKTIGTADLHDLWPVFSANPRPEITTFLIETARETTQSLLAEDDKKAIVERSRRVISLIASLGDCADKQAEEFLLECFAMRDKIASVKGDTGGRDIVEALTGKMSTVSAATKAALIAQAGSLEGSSYQDAFFAARMTRPATDVYDLFAKDLPVKVVGKKRDPKAEALEAALQDRVYSLYRRYHQTYTYQQIEEMNLPPLDPRWLDLAVLRADLNLVRSLMIPGHERANAFLLKEFDEELRKSKTFYDCDLLQILVMYRHPAATDATIRTLQKHGKKGKKQAGYVYWITRSIASLPREAAEMIEAILPELDESIVDPLLEAVGELKAKK